MVSPGDQWRSAITRQCLDSNRNTWGADIQRKPKTKRCDFNRLWQMKPANAPALLQVRGSETCLHARPMLLFSILSYGQQHVSLPFSFLAAARWLAQRQINTSVYESCSPHTPKTIAGGPCAGWPGCWVHSLHTQTAFWKVDRFFFFFKSYTLFVYQVCFLLLFSQCKCKWKQPVT